ncbi:MAG TPA: protein-glutamate O-methyltransferase CheR [Gammaproteobacteria bacterium]|nr:protein-glutamate O-methyltransferase CheR [Gammaproteobacteria bacterium]
MFSYDGMRQHVLADDEFEVLQQLVLDSSGIVLAESSRRSLLDYLSMRMYQLHLGCFQAYSERLLEDSTELLRLINAATQSYTTFCHDRHHFRFFTNTLLPELAKKPEQELRFWSVGCSTGEEAYSLAMVAQEVLPNIDEWDIAVTATDHDPEALSTAMKGIYPLSQVRHLPARHLLRWFRSLRIGNEEYVQISPALQQVVAFRRLNLLSDWTLPEPQDVIFCRDTLIYFDMPKRAYLIDRLADSLEPGGYLFVGESDRVDIYSDRFEALGNAIFRRCD